MFIRYSLRVIGPTHFVSLNIFHFDVAERINKIRIHCKK